MSGQWLDTYLQSQTDIPHDLSQTGIVGEQTLLFPPLSAIDQRNGAKIDNNGALIRILKNTEIDIMLKTVGNQFFPRVVTVQTSPTQIIAPNRLPKGYILINPNTSTSGVVTSVTVFPAGTVFPVGTTNSAPINVSAHLGARFILDVTEASSGPSQFDLQTQDPISGNWATAQYDIFQFSSSGGSIPIGTYYADCGEIGIDNFCRIQANVTTDSLTGSLAAILKPSAAASVAGPTIFLGGPDVNLVIGYPILSGTRETWYLKENTAIYGVAIAPTELRLFELQ